MYNCRMISLYKCRNCQREFPTLSSLNYCESCQYDHFNATGNDEFNFVPKRQTPTIVKPQPKPYRRKRVGIGYYDNDPYNEYFESDLFPDIGDK